MLHLLEIYVCITITVFDKRNLFLLFLQMILNPFAEGFYNRLLKPKTVFAIVCIFFYFNYTARPMCAIDLK